MCLRSSYPLYSNLLHTAWTQRKNTIGPPTLLKFRVVIPDEVYPDPAPTGSDKIHPFTLSLNIKVNIIEMLFQLHRSVYYIAKNRF